MSVGHFKGFKAGSRVTIVPDAFFSQVLPELSDLAELITTFYVFFALGRGRGPIRSVSERSLAAEPPLMRALSRIGSDPSAALRRGLALAASRGTLLALKRPEDGHDAYFLNTDQMRRLLAQRPAVVALPDLDMEEPAGEVSPPNIYALYEENIGSIPPLLLDELSEAEQVYPKPWIEAAFHEAVALNRRNWRYITRILERWKLEGPDYETPGGSAALGAGTHQRSLAGRYRHVVRRAPND